MPSRHGIHQQLTGHSQVDGERPAAIQLNFDELSMPLDAAYFTARQRCGRGIGVAAQYAQATEFGAHDPPSEKAWGQRSRDGFYFGEFRHFARIKRRRLRKSRRPQSSLRT